MPTPAYTPADAARRYLDLGYRVVPVLSASKTCALRTWPTLRLRAEDLPRYFSADSNIGIILGEPSGHLVDIDLDCDEATQLADYFLPHTAAITGRTGAPGRHRWYRCLGAATKRFQDPVTKESLVELRSTGCYTVVGPSVHPSGGTYELLTGEPADVGADELARSVELLYKAILRERGVSPSRQRVPIRRTAEEARTVLAGHMQGEAERRAVAYLHAMPAAVSGQGGHNATYAAAAAVVHGFAVAPDRALDILLAEYNPRCLPPWSEHELRHKVEDAASKPHRQPHGYLLERRTVQECSDAMNEIKIGQRDPATQRLILSPERTLPTANAYLHEHHNHPDGRTLHCCGGMLMTWRGNRYVEVEDAALTHLLQPWLNDALRPKVKRSGDVTLTDFNANPATVRDALETIRTATYIEIDGSMPCWLVQHTDQPPADEVLSFSTGNLHIPTGRLFSPTPTLFTSTSLDFEYSPNPAPPTRWIHFLDECFDGDDESIVLLQDWMGYCLTPDTSLQKMMLIVGPRRSGKGTIGRLLRSLVGESNVAGPTTSSLSGQFGLQPLLNKSLAIVSDARFSGERIAVAIERLLCISGEDALTVDRKYSKPVTQTLPTRFMFMTNELPRLADSSGALAGRFLVLQTCQSFYGREDPDLIHLLLEERPGILAWSLEGWKRVHARKRFIEPASARDAMQDLEELGSPIKAFVRERCVVEPSARVAVDVLFASWRDWQGESAGPTAVTKQRFGRDLASVCSRISRRRTTGGKPFYEGVRLADS